MFGLFKKDPVKALEKKHAQLMEKAMHVQRSGDLKAYAAIIDEAKKVEDEIIELKEKG
ncbi:DUF6435 family protein [Neolewinella agarilytica]|uniref:Lacal_2735 family protein n=1 Tax=Neolewinella agarilytica TaxID=478744 RepID=A0A1H9LR06_9BACT|nr:DUF6435 family protein [Neolewinella agarilytica]SER13595.1 hypothetical protein SAMN05444359_12524 [Neolewinella agarilytica]